MWQSASIKDVMSRIRGYEERDVPKEGAEQEWGRSQGGSRVTQVTGRRLRGVERPESEGRERSRG